MITAAGPASPLRLPERAFAAFARAGGGVADVPALRSAQLSRRMLLVRAVLDSVESWTDPAVSEQTRHAARALATAHARRPDAVNSVLLDPFVGSWAVACLKSGRVGGDGDPRHLGAVAVAAALRAGTPCRVDLCAAGGEVMLPTLGLVRLRTEAQSVEAVLTEDGVLRVGAPGAAVELSVAEILDGRRAQGWSPLLRLRLCRRGLVWTPALNDLDRRGAEVGRRDIVPVDDDAVAAWSDLLGQAWVALVDAQPATARALAATVHTVVPIAPVAPQNLTSGSSANTVGAVALTWCDDALMAAAALAHEWSHTKLHALSAVVRLVGPAGEARFYAPWRADPRPVGGLLNGTYAHLGVCEFWRGLMVGAGARHSVARAALELAEWRGDVVGASRRLRDSDALTPLGARFVAAMLATLNRPCRPPVPAAQARAGVELADERRLAWRLRNLAPASDDVRRLTCAWLAGDAAGPRPATSVLVTSGGDESAGGRRLSYIRLRVLDPGRFDALGSGGEGLLADGGAGREPPADADRVVPGDVALLRGAHGRAVDLYRQTIGAGAGDSQTWVGLARAALSAARARDSGAASRAAAVALGRRPELVRAVYELTVALLAQDTGLRGGSAERAADPVGLAIWLGSAV